MTIRDRLEMALLAVLRRLACRLGALHTPSGPPVYVTTIAQRYDCAICGEGFWK